MKENISQKLQAIEKALNWSENIPEVERLNYRKSLIDIRRELRKIQYAVAERCSTAAFGESQMGKSYLVSAMLSTTSTPFSVTDGNTSYDFIKKINPSEPGSTIEATGVITRFTAEHATDTPVGFLKIKTLSVVDIILVLCEAYYTQIDYPSKDILSTNQINDTISNIQIDKQTKSQRLLTEDDVQDIYDYLRNSAFAKNCNDIFKSEYFSYLITYIEQLSEKQLFDLVTLLWNKEKHLNNLWSDLLVEFSHLNYSDVVYAEFEAVLKQKGSLLDVARLNEMYGTVGNNVEPETKVKINDVVNSIVRIKKSFLSALILELRFELPSEIEKSRPFLKEMDILDFPGAKSPEHLTISQLDEGKYIGLAFRRGKVAYLFNKYSEAKRINSLLFCHNNGDSKESTMGRLLNSWVKGNIGEKSTDRELYMITLNHAKQSQEVAPLFIISTWFNKDLEYNDEIEGVDDLNLRWERRFHTVLETDVLKSINDDQHWFNSWSVSIKPFKNIFMLRDYRFSKTIYRGYDPDMKTPEGYEPKSIRGSKEYDSKYDPDSKDYDPKNNPKLPRFNQEKYPDFFQKLRRSFIDNEFVRLHFINSENAWDNAAVCAKDGTEPIINSLNSMATNIVKARDDKFSSDLNKETEKLFAILNDRYHPKKKSEELKLAKSQAVDANIELRICVSDDPSAFGRLIDRMMISSAEIYELIHAEIIGVGQPIPWTKREAQFVLAAGLDFSQSREWNVAKLCAYFGVDTEQECERKLSSKADVDIKLLLQNGQLIQSKADALVESVEKLWYEQVLMNRCCETFQGAIPTIGTIMSKLWSVYRLLDVKSKLVDKVTEYIETLSTTASVGIIADYLSVKLNAFSSSFGIDKEFMNEKQRQSILSKNEDLKLGIDEAILKDKGDVSTKALLMGLSRQKEILRSKNLSQEDNVFINQYPQFQCLKRWENQLRIGYVFASELPDYDPKANEELGKIMKMVDPKFDNESTE